METERKFTVKSLPYGLDSYPRSCIVQAYISADPVIRVRQMDDRFFLTVKGKGLISHTETEMEITQEAFFRLLKKADGRVIEKTRHYIPFGEYTIELDVFCGELSSLVIAEVEFPSLEAAESFVPPEWFLCDVTFDHRYYNANMAMGNDLPI